MPQTDLALSIHVTGALIPPSSARRHQQLPSAAYAFLDISPGSRGITCGSTHT
ncbi:unnamed protein product [Gulo gulo]|uniref:Uncharacterized protein n=1 Tax=Gulo gulo TaxID=48420 RepID=A0A9X9MB91_GULGU|nr:unnamed protein product [Gulo gulo]